MNTNRSMAWLREAVGGIKYPPDRWKAEKELYAHIIDRNRDFCKAGLTEREADERVCQVMGDPVEVRRELAAIHRPFWGFAFFALRVLVAGILIWALVSFAGNNQTLFQEFRPLVDGECFTLPRWVPQSGKTVCGDYTLTLKRAAWGEEKATGESCLLLDLKAATADPFLGAPRGLNYCTQLNMRAEDSRGRTYPVSLVNSRALVFTSRWLYCVRGIEPGADWVVVTLDLPDGPVWFSLRMKGAQP